MVDLQQKEMIITKPKQKIGVNISPIFYMGNKRRLIAKGLTKLFPEDIDTFYDLFAGSSIVSMNVKANKYVINDKDVWLQTLYKLFKEYKATQIIEEVESRVNSYGLPRERTKRNVYKDTAKIEEYKQNYLKLRTEFNKTKNVFDFYTLMFYSFSQQFRFNNKQEFNMPFGNDCFSEENKTYIQNGCNFFNSGNVYISELHTFANWCAELETNPTYFTHKDFVYLDPPYITTDAVYNEKTEAWDNEQELKLYAFCEKLTEQGVSFALSNVFNNKGKENTHLKEWVYRNNFNVYSFAEHTYTACGKGNAKTQEVLITNYKGI